MRPAAAPADAARDEGRAPHTHRTIRCSQAKRAAAPCPNRWEADISRAPLAARHPPRPSGPEADSGTIGNFAPASAARAPKSVRRLHPQLHTKPGAGIRSRVAATTGAPTAARGISICA
jgi:hypothetical protein